MQELLTFITGGFFGTGTVKSDMSATWFVKNWATPRVQPAE